MSQNRAFAKALSVSFINQIVSSGTNFAVIIFLVNFLDKHSFGLYSLSFAFVLLLSGLISSPISVQYVVNLPDQSPENRLNYALQHLNAITVLVLGLIVLSSFISMLPFDIFGNDSGHEYLLIYIALAGGLQSLREFMVRVAYSEKKEEYVLLSSIVMGLSVFFAMSLMYLKYDVDFSVSQAIFALVIGQAAAIILLQSLMKLPYLQSSVAGLRLAYRESWQSGKWNLLTEVVYIVRTQAHNFIVAPLLGVVAVAEINAARVLVTPAIMAIQPITQIAMPRLAEKRDSGVSKLLFYSKVTVFGMVGISILYSLVMLPISDNLILLVLGEKYSDVGNLVMAWCLVTLALSFRNGLTLVLQVLRDFKSILRVNIAAALIALVLTMTLSVFLAGEGTILALALAEFFLAALLAISLQSNSMFLNESSAKIKKDL